MVPVQQLAPQQQPPPPPPQPQQQPQLGQEDYIMLDYLNRQGFLIVDATPFNQLFYRGFQGENKRIYLPDTKAMWRYNNVNYFINQGISDDVARALSDYLMGSVNRGISIFG